MNADKWYYIESEYYCRVNAWVTRQRGEYLQILYAPGCSVLRRINGYKL